MDTSGIGIGNLGILLIRFELAAIFWIHGWPKLNPNGPMHGPRGFSEFLKSKQVPYPLIAAWCVALLETAGPVLLVLGLLTGLVGLLLAVDMAAAIYLVKRNEGFTKPDGIGWEYEFALLIQGLALLFLGAGTIAL
ncbi:MAG TPA: DoxX family protein [Candidatus Kapabacteria bacterium]|nr:DoxX family protein [Candidatus Kapabacteria bacterium]